LVLSQLYSLGDIMPNTPTIPNIKHCSSFPKSSWIMVLISILFFWCCATIDNFDELIVSLTIIILWFVFGLILLMASYVQKSRST
jgi:hypothetical protein